MSGKLRVSERLYGALLYLYPKEFRAAYDWQMRLTFRDVCRAAYHRNGTGGLLALWLPTLLDLFKSALEERARQGEITMSKARLIALSGPFTVFMGLVLLVLSIGNFLLRSGLSNTETFLILWLYPFMLSFILTLFALIGIQLRFHHAAGILGKLGLTLSVVGCAGVLVFGLVDILWGGVLREFDQRHWVNYAAILCPLGMGIGYILFGVDALRYRLLPRWNLSPLLLGLAVVFSLGLEWLPVPSFFQSQLITPLLIFAVPGACWVLHGLAIMDQRRESQPTAAI